MSNFIQSLIPFATYPYRGQSIPCNLCGGHEKIIICKKDRRWKPLLTVACSDCELMRTDPMPTDEELEQYYRNEYRLDYQFAGTRPPKAHLVRSLRDAQNRVAALGDALKPGARVLDVGCGTGEFLKLAKDLGCEVVGIEPGEAYANFAQAEHGLDVINGLWQDADLPKSGFDVVTCNQVIEHLRDPMAALAAIAAWLKPDGVAFISVPDMRANHKPSFERFHFAHIYGFTPETLEAAMSCNGLVSTSGEALTTTTAIFKKAPNLDRANVAVRDPSRSQALAAAYPDDTIVSYVFGGGYFRHAAHRFRKWRRDTFLKNKSELAPFARTIK